MEPSVVRTNESRDLHAEGKLTPTQVLGNNTSYLLLVRDQGQGYEAMESSANRAL